MRKAFCEVIPHAEHTGYRHSTRLDAVAYYTVACMAKMKYIYFLQSTCTSGWLGSRVVSMLDSGAVGPGFKSQPRRCRVTVLGNLFTPIVPLFTKQRNWYNSLLKGCGGNCGPGGK